jgi:glucose-1-phosphatase
VHPHPKLLLFDLGGVLVEVDAKALHVLDGKGRPDKDLWEVWLTCPVVQQYESGKIGNDEFAEGVIRHFNSTMAPQDFLTSFTAWPLGFFPGTTDLLKSLREQFKLAFLSNSNPLHYPRFDHEWGLKSYFDYHFTSHEMGCAKPEAEIFELLLKGVPFAPEEILFFDDNRLNVEAALKAGIPSEIVRGPDELRAALVTYLPQNGDTPDPRLRKST